MPFAQRLGELLPRDAVGRREAASIRCGTTLSGSRVQIRHTHPPEWRAFATPHPSPGLAGLSIFVDAVPLWSWVEGLHARDREGRLQFVGNTPPSWIVMLCPPHGSARASISRVASPPRHLNPAGLPPPPSAPFFSPSVSIAGHPVGDCRLGQASRCKPTPRPDESFQTLGAPPESQVVRTNVPQKILRTPGKNITYLVPGLFQTSRLTRILELPFEKK